MLCDERIVSLASGPVQGGMAQAGRPRHGVHPIDRRLVENQSPAKGVGRRCGGHTRGVRLLQGSRGVQGVKGMQERPGR